jgi:phosphomannomutase
MSHAFDPAILREYDIRGVVGPRLGTDDARAVGRSFATWIRRGGGSRVVVGCDGRLSSPTLEAALVEGLVAGGLDVIRIGLGPSPMLYYAEAELGVDGGIQVTGSHNPIDDNGFKLVLGHRPFWGDAIQDLARMAAAGDWSEGAGSVTTVDVLDDYVARLMRGWDVADTARPLRIGWDCGNGAAGPAVARLTALLPGEHHLLHVEPDGRFPNHHPDPGDEVNLADLRALVAAENLDFGLAFDGDGDRIGAIDGQGRVLWGDRILGILAEPLLRERPGATIIADVKSSQTVFDRIAALGGTPCLARTGHSPIKAKMVETGAPLAGELSGHIFFADGWYGFDDALYAAVRLIRAVARSGRSLAELNDAMPATVATPDLRIAVPERQRAAVVAQVAARLDADGVTADTTDGLRVTGPDGWWLLRASNTEAAVTVRAEAADDAALARIMAVVDGHLAACGVIRPA